ncbi:phage tail tape measure protein [Streptomyces sp. NPDC002573]|uniref:phage tail tape measure protein n=1 Tax=Streptomyces sp. NPDC002573 TaxID=3364651 RepID=UPI0036867238
MTNVVEILITAKNLTGPAMASVNAEVNKAGTGMAAFHKTALLAGAGLAAIGVESVRMASKFDSSMTLLHTQAGVAQDKMAGLKKGVLDLAGKVGQDPDSLAESLFHVESNFESMGISSSKALHLVETAAKGATTGHADLVDVTNALTAAVASGIPGVQNFDQAMGTLNATVGVGDMKMQDLANAFGSGMVATVKGFGLSITDVGAALAVFGDNNIRGSLAGNQLRMSVMALAKPVATAGDSLQKLGLTQTTLATDMQKGGLKLALEDLVDRMHKAGISSKEQGQIITDAFGRKAGAGLNILVGQMDRLESKYPALEKGAKGFGKSWADTQQTFAFQTKRLQTSLDALMITLGEKLIPPLQSVISLLLDHKSATIGATVAIAGLLTATVAVSAAMKVAAAASMLWAAGGKAIAGLGSVFESVALKAMYMKGAFAAAGGGVAGLKAAFMELGTVGKMTVVAGGIALVAAAVVALSQVGKRTPPDVDKMTTSIEKLGMTGQTTGESLRIFGKDMDGLAYDVDRVAGKSSGMDKFNDVMNSIFTLGSEHSNSFNMAKEDIGALDKSLASLVEGGKANLAAAALKNLEDAYAKHGGDPKKLVGELSAYQNALAGSAIEQKLTAQGMGIFGAQAVVTQGQLDDEAQSAKGLEQSIMALNTAHRSAFDAETAFHQAIADAKQAIKDNGRTLDINTDAGRKNRDVLSQLAAKTEDLVDKKLKEKTSWDQVDKTYQQGRKNLIDVATAMTGSKEKAKELADELLKAPEAKKLQITVDKKAAESDINDFNAAVRKSPGSKSVTLKTLSSGAEQILNAFGFKVTHLKNGSVTVSAKTGQALSGIGNVQSAVDALNGKTAIVTVMINGVKTGVDPNQYYSQGPHAKGGPVRGYAVGGSVQAFPGGGYVQGPGGGTSDSITAISPGGAYRVSNTEYVVQSSAVKKYGVGFFDALNAGRLKLAGFAKGGLTQAERDARGQLRGEFGISGFGRLAGYKRTPFERGLGAPDGLDALVSSLNDAAGQIRAAFRGRTETHLLKELDSVGKSLIRYDKNLNSVNASLDNAKTKLNDLKNSASQLSDSVRSGILSSANVTGVASAAGGQPISVASIMGAATQSRDKAQAFANALKDLKAKGLDKGMLQDIAEAGINGGGLETAGALMGASSSEIQSLNTLRSQTATYAKQAGQTTADAVYGAAIKAQDKLVKSLEKQQARLEKAMADLAKVMERALSRAAGKASGGIVGAAATGGARGGLTWVGEYEPELLELPVGSRVHSGPDSRRMAAAAGSHRDPIVLEIRSSGSEIDELFLKVFRRIVRVRGGNVQMILAGRPA